MPLPLPVPRHTVEKSGSDVRVTLPVKRNLFYILWTGLFIFAWGQMLYAFLASFIFENPEFDLAKVTLSETENIAPIIVFGIIVLLFILFFLGFGLLAIYSFLWLIIGKEIFEANSSVLKVTRQLYSWKRTREYAAEDVKDLRVTTKQLWFGSTRALQKLLGSNGMIAFDYGAKTIRFGLEIDEAEAKQIILALK
ncbi:MAG: hypothetical protein ABFS17_07275, partial [Chloroflexota bacterium]